MKGGVGVDLGSKYTARVVATASLGATSTELTFKFFATSSGGTDMTDTTTAASSTPIKFSYPSTAGLPTGRTFTIARTNWMIQDGTIKNAGFGGISTGLAVGLKIGVYSSSTVSSTVAPDTLDFMDGQTLKKHNQFTYLAGIDVIPSSTTPSNDGFVPVRWSLDKAGAPLTMAPGQQFRIVVQDNLAALTEFQAMIQGVLRSTT